MSRPKQSHSKVWFSVLRFLLTIVPQSLTTAIMNVSGERIWCSHCVSGWGSLFSSTDERCGHRELKQLIRRQTARQYGKIGLLAPGSAPFTTRLPLNAKLLGPERPLEGTWSNVSKWERKTKSRKLRRFHWSHALPPTPLCSHPYFKMHPFWQDSGGMLSGQGWKAPKAEPTGALDDLLSSPKLKRKLLEDHVVNNFSLGPTPNTSKSSLVGIHLAFLSVAAKDLSATYIIISKVQSSEPPKFLSFSRKNSNTSTPSTEQNSP